LGALAVHPIKRQFREKLDRKKGRNTKKKKKKLEPMIGYKYPSIALGATYIMSTGYAPHNK
jgi:hypothetical protein